MGLLPKFSKWQIKLALVFAGMAIVVTTILYIRVLVDELIDNERKKISVYAEIYKKITQPDAKNIDDMYFLVQNLAPTIFFPVIFTNENNEPEQPYDQWAKNINVDTSLSIKAQREYMLEYLKKMESQYQPIVAKDNQGNVLFKIYYTHSDLIDRLQLFPILEFIIIFIIIFIGYLTFSNIRKNQESKVWIGMAKEAAHQLGTPLSSLLAWLEIIRNSRKEPEFIDETTLEMENDINRLSVIATRFSKIGSVPDLSRENIRTQINGILAYFEKRLPHVGKKIELKIDIEQDAFALISRELFAWVIENLLKNAVEAIESREGFISIHLHVIHPKKIQIIVKDSGKGMNSKQRRQAFHPGFTTKKRGWGLGLSLSKRIIEQYHKGKIYIKDSSPGKGTTFIIELPYNNIEKLY